MNYFIKLQILSLVFIHTTNSSSKAAKFHVATEQEIKDKASTLDSLGDEYIVKDGVPLHIKLYTINDQLIQRTKSLQQQLNDCLNAQTLDPHYIDQSVLFQSLPNDQQIYELQHKLHQAHQEIKHLHLHLDDSDSAKYIHELERQNQALRKENEMLQKQIKDQSQLIVYKDEVHRLQSRLDQCTLSQLNSEQTVQQLRVTVKEKQKQLVYISHHHERIITSPTVPMPLPNVGGHVTQKPFKTKCDCAASIQSLQRKIQKLELRLRHNIGTGAVTSNNVHMDCKTAIDALRREIQNLQLQLVTAHDTDIRRTVQTTISDSQSQIIRVNQELLDCRRIQSELQSHLVIAQGTASAPSPSDNDRTKHHGNTDTTVALQITISDLQSQITRINLLLSESQQHLLDCRQTQSEIQIQALHHSLQHHQSASEHDCTSLIQSMTDHCTQLIAQINKNTNQQLKILQQQLRMQSSATPQLQINCESQIASAIDKYTSEQHHIQIRMKSLTLQVSELQSEKAKASGEVLELRELLKGCLHTQHRKHDVSVTTNTHNNHIDCEALMRRCPPPPCAAQTPNIHVECTQSQCLAYIQPFMTVIQQLQINQNHNPSNQRIDTGNIEVGIDRLRQKISELQESASERQRIQTHIDSLTLQLSQAKVGEATSIGEAVELRRRLEECLDAQQTKRTNTLNPTGTVPQTHTIYVQCTQTQCSSFTQPLVMTIQQLQLQITHGPSNVITDNSNVEAAIQTLNKQILDLKALINECKLRYSQMSESRSNTVNILMQQISSLQVIDAQQHFATNNIDCEAWMAQCRPKGFVPQTHYTYVQCTQIECSLFIQPFILGIQQLQIQLNIAIDQIDASHISVVINSLMQQISSLMIKPLETTIHQLQLQLNLNKTPPKPSKVPLHLQMSESTSNAVIRNNQKADNCTRLHCRIFIQPLETTIHQLQLQLNLSKTPPKPSKAPLNLQLSESTSNAVIRNNQKADNCTWLQCGIFIQPFILGIQQLQIQLNISIDEPIDASHISAVIETLVQQISTLQADKDTLERIISELKARLEACLAASPLKHGTKDELMRHSSYEIHYPRKDELMPCRNNDLWIYVDIKI